MVFVRNIRAFFFKEVALLGVPFRDWKITLGATIFSAIFLYIFLRTIYFIPVWFVGSLGIGLGLASFFLWAHNKHNRGWLNYSVSYYFRELIGIGQNLLREPPGRIQTEWLIDAGDQPASGKNFKWFRNKL